MADDMRTKAYPPLPPKGSGPRIAIVLPTLGDLRLRSLLPDAFQQQLVVHASGATAPLYARFVVVRRFVVMSSDGDLFTQTVRATLELKDLPRQQLLSLPSISPWDIVKVLDLVQCFSASASARWELVRVRWKSGMVTWLPIELLQRNFATLLQEFYVNSINSWAFRDRIYAQSIQSFQTEVELWLHHDEFRKFYQFLRQRRAMAAAERGLDLNRAGSTPTASHSQSSVPDVKTDVQRPLLHAQDTQPSPARVLTHAREAQLPRQRLEVQQPHQQQLRERQGRRREEGDDRVAQHAQHRRQEEIQQEQRPHYRRQEEQQGQEQHARLQQREQVAPSSSKKTKPLSASASHPRPQVQPPVLEPTQATSSRAKTRSPSLPSSAPMEDAGRDSAGSSPTDTGSSSKQFKRLRKRRAADAGSDNDDVDDILLKVPRTSTPEQPSSASSLRTAPVTIIDEEDEAAEDDAKKSTPMVIGDIRCVCRADSVGTYGGRWLHCWNDECGVWEHGDCVGLLAPDDPSPRYICSNCDPLACRSRRAAARVHLVDWLFQCCESKNSTQVLKLLRANPSQETTRGWRNLKAQNMTLLMKAAGSGLLHVVQYLVHVAKVDVFAIDAGSLNALHHAVLGGKRRCTQYLLSQEPKLLQHQDKTGRTPFHCLLESPALNDLCLEQLVEDRNLAVVGDFESNSPIHYACRALTPATVEIVRILLQDQPMSLVEESSDGFSPFLLLCKADACKLSSTTWAGIVKAVVKMMLDIDVLGSFFASCSLDGWTGLHFAAAGGNHELVSFLAQCEHVDIHATTTGASETALHIAARSDHALCVRELLRAGSKETAKDASGWIPMLYAESGACIQEFLPYKLTKQISRLNRMAAKYQQRDVVRQWQRRVVMDSACFNMLNDWCQSDLERIRRMDAIFLTGPFMLRLDNKLNYLYTCVFPALRTWQRTSDKASEGEGRADVSSVVEAASRSRTGIRFVFSSSRESCWKQFVGMAKALEPEVFRAPMQFANSVGGDGDDGDGKDGTSFKLILLRLIHGLSAIAPGFLLHGVGAQRDRPQQHPEQEKLLDFYLLGELVAHLVLYDVSLSGIASFTTSFLRCAFGQPADEDDESADESTWSAYGRSFAGGFDHVIPSVLKTLHPEEFRVLLHGRKCLLDAQAVEWERALDWRAVADDGGVELRSWLARLLLELGIEEQQLVLLTVAESYPAAKQWVLLESKGCGDATHPPSSRIRVVWHTLPDALNPAVTLSDADDATAESDALMPFVDHTARTLSFPRYSSYAAFKRAMLRALRHSDRAFRRR